MTDRQVDPAVLDAALERIVTAARDHLAAVRAADGRTDDDQVWQSYVALNNASFEYDGLLLETYGEVTPWDVDLIDPEEAEHEAVTGGAGAATASDEQPITVSVRQRRDYTVPSVAALLRVAEQARHDNPAADEVDEPIATVGEAVVELMQSGDGSLGSLDLPELEPLRGVVTVTELATPEQPADLDEQDDSEVFQTGPKDRVLCRVDEQAYEDES